MAYRNSLLLPGHHNVAIMLLFVLAQLAHEDGTPTDSQYISLAHTYILLRPFMKDWFEIITSQHSPLDSTSMCRSVYRVLPPISVPVDSHRSGSRRSASAPYRRPTAIRRDCHTVRILAAPQCPHTLGGQRYLHHMSTHSSHSTNPMGAHNSQEIAACCGYRLVATGSSNQALDGTN